MNKIYIVRGRGHKAIQSLQIQIALMLGYDVQIITPTDNCRGHRANIIEWVDDFPEFQKDLKKPIDTPTK